MRYTVYHYRDYEKYFRQTQMADTGSSGFALRGQSAFDHATLPHARRHPDI